MERATWGDQMKRFLHALGNAFLTIVVLLLIAYGWVFVEIKLLLKSYPELFGYVFYLQETGDMTSQFEEQDIVLVKRDADYQIGDIIMYFDSADSKYKAHYVVSKDTNSTTTKCITCDKNNEPISNDNVVGKAIGKIAFMGVLVSFFSQKIVLIGFAVVGITFLIISQYIEYQPRKKESEQNSVAKSDIN